MQSPAATADAEDRRTAAARETAAAGPSYLDGARPPGRTTGQWLTLGVSAALAVLAALSVAGILDFAHGGAVTDRLVGRSWPALVTAVRLEDAVVNQETGVRGYALSGQRVFLQPYTQGLADEQAELAALRPLIAGDPTAAADLDLFLQRAALWQRETAEPIADAPPGAPIPVSVARLASGKSEFDALRAAAAVQQQHLTDDLSASDAGLRTVRNERTLVFSAIALVIVLLTVLIFVGLRRGVTSPLERLSTDARRVAGGDFSHPIAESGPADLRHLARTVEDMRERLAGELELAVRTRRQLDEQAAELQRSNAELEQFAYVASHDLQEPLRKITSFCQLLQRRLHAGELDERADQYIAIAVDGAARMQTLINDLLAFSRVGRLHQEYAEVRLEAVLAAAAESLSVAVAECGAVITHDPLPAVLGNATQLGVLFQNLLGNAVKFRSPERPPRIHVEAVRDGDAWRFAVRDNGIGIEPAYAERVFVIFQRLHTRDAYPGNGIGLAMCKKIVEFHGGVIEVDPDYTGGTRIAFTLPTGDLSAAGGGPRPISDAGV